jgi:hypothetical protein
MGRASLPLGLLCLTLFACTNDPPAGEDGGSSETGGTGTGTDASTETGVLDMGTLEDMGTPEVGDHLRFVAAGSYSSVLVALDLDDPLNVPSPEYVVATGTGIAGMFGPTPSGTQAVTHEGQADQLHLNPTGELSLSPLLSLETFWIDSLWFAGDGSDALLSVSPEPGMPPGQLLWATYDDQGELMGSFDITPPIQPGGVVSTLGRSPDSSHAAIIIDAEPDSTWEIWLLPFEPEPGMAELIDQVVLQGIPPLNVPDFLWVHVDDQRIAYRREVLPMIRRPVAVPLNDPEAAPINLVPGLDHVYSIVWSDDSARMVVTTGGSGSYHDLNLVDLDGPTSAGAPILLTEPGIPALLDANLPMGRTAPGHGFDAMNRVWYAYATSNQGDAPVAGITLVTVEGGMVVDRLELADVPPGMEIGDIFFDPQAQLLGYRVQAPGESWICYVDLTAAQPTWIRVDQEFDHSELDPTVNATYGWSADGSRIAVTGVQLMGPILHTAEIGDPSGATTAIPLPDVLLPQGVNLTKRPEVSPKGEQVMLWYTSQAEYTGLIHAPTDGSGQARVVLGLMHTLVHSTYMTTP